MRNNRREAKLFPRVPRGSLGANLDLTLRANENDGIDGGVEMEAKGGPSTCHINDDFDKGTVGGGFYDYGNGVSIDQDGKGGMIIRPKIDPIHVILGPVTQEVAAMTKGIITPTFTGSVGGTIVVPEMDPDAKSHSISSYFIFPHGTGLYETSGHSVVLKGHKHLEDAIPGDPVLLEANNRLLVQREAPELSISQAEKDDLLRLQNAINPGETERVVRLVDEYDDNDSDSPVLKRIQEGRERQE